MSVTIQIQEYTKGLLDSVKTKEDFTTHDAVIRHLIETHVDTATMFGITREKPLRFRKEDELTFHEL